MLSPPGEMAAGIFGERAEAGARTSVALGKGNGTSKGVGEGTRLMSLVHFYINY